MAEEKSSADLGKALKPQQRRFVQEYMVDLNGTAAAVRAGYGERNAASTASRLLRRPEVQAYRDALLKEAFEAIGIDKYNIVLKTWEIFQRCAEKKPVLEWDSAQREWVPSGQWQFDSKGALRALDMLAKLLPGLRREEDQGPSYEDLLGEE